jgi:hypothetical protein
MLSQRFFDMKRVMSLPHLEAVCEYLSENGQSYGIESVSESTVRVVCTINDDGTERSVFTEFPCYHTREAGNGQQAVALVLDITGRDNHEDESIMRTFEPLLRCPALWRNPTSNRWESVEHIPILP